ncbi:MAG: HNH endonuclease [Cyanobacteria bacterium J06643_5]
MSKIAKKSQGQQAWLLIVNNQTDYAEHLSYADEISKVYQYNNFVPNHKQISEGDIALVRNKNKLIGIAKIESIKESQDTRKRFRCPSCTKTNIKTLKNKQFKYKCAKCGHNFNEPDIEIVNCKLYSAYFGNSFLPAEEAISIETLQKACPKFNRQLSMQLLNFKQIEDALLQNLPEAKQLIVKDNCIKADNKITETENDFIPYSYNPIIGDRRQLVIRQILARQGQPQFRKALQDLYGKQCMVSRCQLLDIVEAAHISPYRGIEDNHPENGLLLRVDLHTLFDLDLMGIHPESLQVSFHPTALVNGYTILEGKKLLCCNIKPSKSALNLRWNKFNRRLKA